MALSTTDKGRVYSTVTVDQLRALFHADGYFISISISIKKDNIVARILIVAILWSLFWGAASRGVRMSDSYIFGLCSILRRSRLLSIEGEINSFINTAWLLVKKRPYFHSLEEHCIRRQLMVQYFVFLIIYISANVCGSYVVMPFSQFRRTVLEINNGRFANRSVCGYFKTTCASLHSETT